MKPVSSPTNPELDSSEAPVFTASEVSDSNRDRSNQGIMNLFPIKLGTIGYFSLLICSLALAMFVPFEKLPWAILFSFIVTALFYPNSIRRIFNLRWLFFLIIIAIPPIFFLGSLDSSFFNIRYSSIGVQEAIRMIARFLIILLAISGFTEMVDISAIAGILERFGLQGLGFSLGVAMNMLPALQQSSINSWQSLWLRGGFRMNRLTSLKFLVTTIVTNALQQAENIALAAEARAFNPAHSRPAPIKKNRFDYVIVPIEIFIFIWFLL